MARHLRRHKSFELSLTINDEAFIRPPRDAQRQWVVGRAVDEIVGELEHLDRIAPAFVPGSDTVRFADRTNIPLSDQEIMEDWQVPVMEVMARLATAGGGDVLEIGFGRGVSAEMIQKAGVRSHTIVECNDSVVARFSEWREHYADRDIHLIHGTWQDTTDQLESYDAVFFHTYPLNEDEYIDNVARSVTFAEHFFPTASAHLRSGGVFTYLTNEADSLSRAHQRLVFEYFRRMSLEVVGPLSPPQDSNDVLWGDSMVVIGAVK